MKYRLSFVSLIILMCAVAYAAAPLLTASTTTAQTPAVPSQYPGAHWVLAGTHTVYDWQLMPAPATSCAYAGNWSGNWGSLRDNGSIKICVTSAGAVTLSGTAEGGVKFTGKGQITGSQISFTVTGLFGEPASYGPNGITMSGNSFFGGSRAFAFNVHK